MRTTIRNLQEKFVDLSRIYFEGGAIPSNYEFIPPSSLKNVPGVVKSTNLKN